MKRSELAAAKVDAKTAKAHGLSDAEYASVQSTLGRVPTLTELGIYSAMWSEHCSYKSSRQYLSRLPTRAAHVVQGPGENAGVVQLAPGLAVSFKVESHNHPSYVEPHQGAATGVGGILRDIIVMGARPIALLDSLHFGFPSDLKSHWVASGVVSGISAYGNCIGVPTVGGEVHFADCYRQNPLVNVMAIGVLGPGGIKKGIARGKGNPVIAFGARTGRDGIHGAAFASAELDAGSEADRPAVQVGDPFMGKLLLEACQELFGLPNLIGIQDMGAAGLTSSTVEMADRGGVGLRLDMDRVPVRETGMSAYEIMLSESQERMIMVVEKGTEAAAIKILERWGLAWAVIGEVTDTGHIVVVQDGNVVADIPTDHLTKGCPAATRQAKEPAYLARVNKGELADVFATDLPATVRQLLSSPNLSSRRDVFEQYDYLVGTNTIVRPGRADAAVLRLKGTEHGIAATTDVNARACYLDPREGARQTVAEAARNLACVGARPLGMTDGLNFASPEDPEIYWQFVEIIEGIREASLALGIPVTGGNVSFYNQTGDSAVYPTPVIGMIGAVDQPHQVVDSGFRAGGHEVYLLGSAPTSLGGSEYLAHVHGRVAGPLPRIDLEAELRLHDLLRAASRAQLLQSAHDISSGGLITALVECCSIPSTNVGLKMKLPDGVKPDLALFAEDPGRVVVSVKPAHSAAFRELCRQQTVPVVQLGTTGGDRLQITGILDERLEEVASWRTGTLFSQTRTADEPRRTL